MTYEEWIRRYQSEWLSRTGLSPDEAYSEERLEEFYREGIPHDELVDQLIDKDGLTDLQLEPWHGDIYEGFRQQALKQFGYAPKSKIH